MAKHRADEPTSDQVPDVVDVPDVLDVEIVPLDATPPPTAMPIDTGYTAAGVPTFDSVREKIETRFGTSVGAAELAAETPEGRSVEEQYDTRQRAAAERVAQIRASMRDEPGPTSDPA